jgi:hypothetical protein
MTCEMGPRFAGIVCTETTGSFSFSALAHPPTKNKPIMAQAKAIEVRRIG